MALACAALLMVACADDAVLAPELPAENGGGQGSNVYVSVAINIDGMADTRAPGSPLPGEDGDGSQPGQGDENVVRDVNVFFFQDESGINGSSDTPITLCLYFAQLTQSTTTATADGVWVSDARDVTDLLEMGQTYQVLAIANLGRSLERQFTTLGQLRDYTVSQTVVSGTSGGQRFLMASATDGAKIEIVPSTQDKPVTVTVDVERMAARVDCAWENIYEITGDNMPSEGGNPGRGDKDEVKMLGAALVNRYRRDTYAFKRVTEGTELTPVQGEVPVIYLGDEIPAAQGTTQTAGNYVLDPQTMTGKEGGDYTYYYTEFVGWNVDEDFTDPTARSLTSTHEGRTYYCLDYARENVNTVAQLSETENRANVGIAKYATGIMFKAQYTPAGFTAGETFYVYPEYESSGDLTIYTEEQLRQEHYATFGNMDVANWPDVTGLQVYRDGCCYYVYWIRHADDDNDFEISPMEYALVRNNIYQLYVNGIEALGNPDPDSQVEEVEVDIHLNVKEWETVNVRVPDFD